MWAHYSSCHTGVCIALSTSSLQDLIHQLKREFGLPGELVKVDYAAQYPLIDVFGDEFQWGEWSRMMISTKSTHWAYEEEYRFFVRSRIYDKPLEHRCHILPDGAISKVILGARMSEETRQEILTMLAARTDIAVEEARLKEYEFGLEFNRVDSDR